MSESSSSTILIRGVNWVGDAVMTLPAVRAVKKAFPGAKVSLLVKPLVKPVFEGDPAIDEIIEYDERFRGITGRLSLARLLGKRGFSHAILLQNAFDAALLAFLAGVPERIGYDRDGRGLLLTRRVPFTGGDRKIHHIRYYLDLLNAAGIPAEYTHPWICLSGEEKRAARERLAAMGRPVLGINPGATYGSAKRWFPERFTEVARRFISETGGSVVIFGGPKETDIAQEIHEAAAGHPLSADSSSSLLNLAGKTSLRELMALIAECDALLTNDSGPMHIAYAVGTPSVSLFGSTSPELTGPVGEGNVVLRKDMACSPCFERTCKNGDMKCMDALSGEEVYRAIGDILPRRRAVFFDRDGTLCRDAHYLNKWEDFELFSDLDSLQLLKARGFVLIGVSNQSGIHRGLVQEAFVREVNSVFTSRYGFDAFYYCPHGPGEGCPCRKPAPSMLLTARGEHRIDLRRSYVVGDKDDDMLLARAVGAKGILVKTGKQAGSDYADHIAENLRDAVEYILVHE
ncbi:MAG: lipopolysaccharide heptosyltransferase II [Alphaproteobacteria bacterium]|uniref:lipopolysaccharide heptosyltransferase II n=1 Tax=Candidatus Nitrobium versatile TaxID=2884831 RepID=A0A953JAH9_9BACT|nr:lipopolysaccharide heptosyltransferase II [Candidatus Nitrobium versatile]